MKLYNLFNEIILEESKKLLTENVSEEQVKDAIENKYNVNILYDDYPDEVPSVQPSKRYIQVYNFAETKAGNKAIRAFQIFGGSKTTPKEGAWKIFRLDRIRGWYPTKMKFNKPVSDKDLNLPKYNNDGDRTMRTVFNKVDFNKIEPEKDTNTAPLPPKKQKNVKQKSSYIASGNPKPEKPVGVTGLVKKPINTSNTTK
jgi:hypothetical protein